MVAYRQHRNWYLKTVYEKLEWKQDMTKQEREK